MKNKPRLFVVSWLVVAPALILFLALCGLIAALVASLAGGG